MAASTPQGPDRRFECSFERNYADIARYCARRTTSPQDAEDAATEAFATAWRRRRELPPAPADRLWLFGIARHVVANAIRAERRRSRLTSRLAAQPLPPPAPPPSASAEAVRLAAALSSLSATDRELLLLTGWEELTPGQIAQLLNRPVALVSRRLYRARRRLAAALEHSAGTPSTRPLAVGDLMESE